MNSLDCKCKVCGKPISEYDYKYRNKLCYSCHVNELYMEQQQALLNDEHTETEYENDIVCPWCGCRMQDDDGYFVSEQSGEYDCPECEVTYSTRGVVE